MYGVLYKYSFLNILWTAYSVIGNLLLIPFIDCLHNSVRWMNGIQYSPWTTFAPHCGCFFCLLIVHFKITIVVYSYKIV